MSPLDRLLADPERLAAVDRLLPVAAARRERLDRLAELAAVVMDAPVAFVSLVDGATQRLVGVSGGDPEFAARREVAPEQSYCTSTLLAGEAVFVEDAAVDPAFATHPALVELGLRAYAGAPLRDTDGHLVGTLCVADDRPREWTRPARAGLVALAASVVSELDLHLDLDRRGQLLAALDGAPAAIAVARGPQLVVEYTNAGLRSLFGDLPVGVPMGDVLPEQAAALLTRKREVLATGRTTRAREAPVELVWPGEQAARTRWFDFSFSPIGPAGVAGAVLTVAVEVTDRIEAHRRATAHANRQEVLARAAASLHGSLDPDAELRALASAVVPELADVSTVHRLHRPVPPGVLPPLPVVADRVVVTAAVESSVLPGVARGLRWVDGSSVVDAIVAGRTVLVPVDVAAPPAWAESTGVAPMIRAGMHTVAVAPVVVDDLVVAVVTFGCFAGRAPWVPEELDVLGQVAGLGGRALSQGLSYQQTRTSALTLQRSMLTEPPEIDGLALCVRYRPAGADEIGGDWYDTFRVGGGSVAVVVGDVVGHDITAAAAMGQLRATLRGLAVDRDEDPTTLLGRLDTVIGRLGITPFATVLYGRLSPDDDGAWRMDWASAGHPPPLLLGVDGAPSWLDQAHGLVLGTRVGDATGRRGASTLVRPGETVLLYTDGLVERRDRPIRDGMAALAGLAVPLAARPLAVLCDAAVRAAATDDDIAVLALRPRELAPPPADPDPPAG